MKRLAILFLTVGNCWAQDTAKIESIGLFKNGLAVVRVTDSIPKSGKLNIESIPEPVHGTFWISSEKPVSARIAINSIKAPLATVSQPELLQHLVGKEVVIHLEDDTIEGVLLGETPEQRKEWDRNYSSVGGQASWRYWSGGSNQPRPQLAQVAFVKTEGGIIAVQTALVKRVAFSEMPEIQRGHPVLRLESEGGGAVAVEYLSKGISWAPSYRIDITDPKTLTIEQKTVIRNELANLEDVELRLISGFPSVRFANVDSPLSVKQTWAKFFQQLINVDSNSSSGGSITMNQAVFSQVGHGGFNAPPGGAALGPADEGESVDLHYESVGRHSLAPGESLALDVAEAKAKYERVVEWNIPDTRGPNGRHLAQHQRQQQKDQYDESAWDAIVFQNPFTFPMTTAPAMLSQGGNFQGQQTSTWTNPGAETSVRITKALSVATRAVENEIPKTRQNLRIAGNDYYKVQVQGELTVKNHRGKPAILVIKRRFSGELIEADEEPATQLLEVGIYSVNKRNELRWRIELAAGKEQVIKYRYEVLVDN